jgi:hypothetical protein
MKQLWQSVKVINMKEIEGKIILQIALDATVEDIKKYLNKGAITGELRFDDDRRITAEQRKKIFATIRDISLYTGDEPEYLRDILQFMYCTENDIEHISLSNCSLEVAREFISYLIEFCIDNQIPPSESIIERTDDINKYLYITIKKSVCCCCGDAGVIYTVGKDKISLCNKHHDEAKLKGLKEFEKMYKVYPIKIKE